MIDLRNHGDSDWHTSMTLKEMGEDVIRYADKRNIEKFTILGHSTGGKVAMVISMLHPERINGIIVLDAPPKNAQKDVGYITKTVGLVKTNSF